MSMPLGLIYPRCESPIEWRLYNALARKGYNVRTQVRCGPYRIDMCIGNIAIECDGKDFHSSPEQKKYDKRRTSYLYRNGYRSVLRFTGSDINRNVNNCVNCIENKLAGAVSKCKPSI
jgi:very-short-patch-repair endonuclease